MWTGGVRVIIPVNGKILMVKQSHEGRDIWMAPGGGINDGETSAQAGIREVKEETGLDVEITGIAWHIEEATPERGQRFVNYMIGKVTGGTFALGKDPELPDNGQVLKEMKFLSREEIGKLEHINPPFFNEEIWDILNKKEVNNTYKIRKNFRTE